MQYLTVQLIEAVLNLLHFLVELLEVPVDQRSRESQRGEPPQKRLAAITITKLLEVGYRPPVDRYQPLLADQERDRIVANSGTGQLAGDQLVIDCHALT